MHREVIAIALCILAQAATAQSVALSAHPANAPEHAQPVAAREKVRAAGTAKAAPAAARAELIKTAAAGTRDDEPPAMTARPHAHDQQQDHPRRGGTAMLLAALALMSGIALRRYSAPKA